MKTYFPALCWLLLGYSVSLHAQADASLQGHVQAAADGSSLAGASIFLEGPVTIQTVTNAEGYFLFQRAIPGTYTLVVSKAGFSDEKRQITLRPRETADLLVKLSLGELRASVEVRSDRSTLEAYSPSSTVLQRSFIDTMPSDRKNNLTDMVAAAAPGMVRGHDDFVHVRGHEVALNTFINGVSFWENPHSVLSSGLPPDIIQSANVLTGGFPAEYGNRFGGVVDVVTKSGFAENDSGSVTLSAGTALRHNAAFEFGGHGQNAGYYLYGATFESARFLSPNDRRSIHDTGRGTHNFAQFDFNLSPSNLLKLIVMGDGTNFEIPKTAADDQLRPNLNPFEKTRGQSTMLTWSHTAHANTLLTTSLYQRWSRMTFNQENEPLASTAQNERTLLTVGLKSDLTHLAGRHTWRAGIDVVRLQPDESLFFDGEGYITFSHLTGLPHTHLRGPDRGPILFSGSETGGQGSLYVQDAFQWTPRLKANVGVRVDSYHLVASETHVSPRTSLSYRLSDKGTVLYASYDHFFVPPPMENVLISSAGLTRYLQGFDLPLPPVQPIVENQVELGLTHPVHSALRMGATAYYRQSRNPVHTVLFPDSRVYTYANFDRAKAYGLELKTELASISRLGLSGYLNYAWSRVYFWNPVIGGFVDETHHLEDADRFFAPMDQTHTLNANVTYRNRGFWASVNLEYGSGTPIEPEHDAVTAAQQRLPGHFTEDVTLGVDFMREANQSRLSLQFNVENLTNNVYRVSQESSFSPGEYYNPRSFSTSLKVRF